MAETLLGLVVNPKLARPVLVTLTTHREVTIRRLDEEGWPLVGQGYYGDEDERAVTVTGFPRSHTPRGVKIKGQGYGTCLYTALCLGAHQNHEYHEGDKSRAKLFRYEPTGDGICSVSDDRSSEADAWWESASGHGLARSETDEEVEENIDATSDLRGELEDKPLDEGTVTYVNQIIVDVTKTLSVDVYPWSRAERHNLVAADFTLEMPDGTAEVAYKKIMEPSNLEIVVEPEWILALDVRDLTLSAINLLGILAQVAGAGDDDLHALRYRWEAGLDPSAEIKQQRLPFRPNSSERRELVRSLDRAEEARARAGWSTLADLP